MVALAHGAGCTDDGPDCQAAAEGNEGLFADAAPYLVEGVLAVEVAGAMSAVDVTEMPGLLLRRRLYS